MKKSILSLVALCAALPLCAFSFLVPSHAASDRRIAGAEEPDTVVYEEEDVWSADTGEVVE